MSRPIYYFAPGTEYTLLKDGDDGCVFEFSASPQSVAVLRKPKCFMSTSGGLLRFLVKGMSVLPGPPVEGLHRYSVETTRMV